MNVMKWNLYDVIITSQYLVNTQLSYLSHGLVSSLADNLKIIGMYVSLVPSSRVPAEFCENSFSYSIFDQFLFCMRSLKYQTSKYVLW